jgi:hypothetical protein
MSHQAFAGFNFAALKAPAKDERQKQFEMEFKRWMTFNQTEAGKAHPLPDVAAIRLPTEGMVAWDYMAHVMRVWNGSAWA